MDLNTSWIKLFDENKSLINEQSCNLLNTRRIEALEQFKLTGIPSTKTEAYKYTDLQPFFGTDKEHSFSAQIESIRVPEEFSCNVESMEALTVFTVNGYFVLLQKYNLPNGVTVSSFADAARNNPNLLDAYYSKIASSAADPFVALNTMLALDGFFIHIPKNIALEKPIQIINILNGDENLSVMQRNMIIVEEGARVNMLVCDHTLSSANFAVNSVTEIEVGNRANLDFCNLQNRHNNTAQVNGYYFNQQADSSLRANYIALHAGMIRNNISIRLGGEHAECFLSGLYLCDKKQHVDNFTFIDHAVPDCYSSELFKGVMDDSSTAAFTGKIMVRSDAQRTNAYQSNNNLLLTNEARINTKPQLEIYADDVKCSHGATVGQLDENALFYMRQRGISKEEANILLQYAFAYEVIEKIKLPALKEQIRPLVEKRFRGKLDKCDSCILCGRFNNKLGC